MALGALTNSISAMVNVTTPAIPISISGSGSYALDLNGDSITEVTMSFYDSLDLMRIASSNGTRWVQDPAGMSNFPAQLGDERFIDSNDTFVTAPGWNFGPRLTEGAGWIDPVTGEGGGGIGFIGFEFTIGTDTHYGWAQFDFPGGEAGYSILAYAYETTPNTGLYTSAPVVPEPAATAAFAGLGIAGFVLLRRRKQS